MFDEMGIRADKRPQQPEILLRGSAPADAPLPGRTQVKGPALGYVPGAETGGLEG